MHAFYTEIPTDAFHKAYIQKIWILNNSFCAFHTPPKYALPNGCCTMVFITGNGVMLNFADKQIELSQGIYLCGQLTGRVAISLKPHSKAIMAQLKPWLPALITNVPMNELINNVVDMALINRKLHQNWIYLDFANETILLPRIYAELRPYLSPTNDSYFVQWAFTRLQKAASTPKSVAAMAEASGYTQRRIEQKFKSLIGPSAKQIQHILQLRVLIDGIDSTGHKNNLSYLAHRHGYYDQSHFIKSYQRIIAEAPSQFNSSDYILPIAGHFGFLQS